MESGGGEGMRECGQGCCYWWGVGGVTPPKKF